MYILLGYVTYQNEFPYEYNFRTIFFLYIG